MFHSKIRIKKKKKILTDFVVESIKYTLDDIKDHLYGVKFERALPELIKTL